MKFKWDSRKAQQNFLDHEISFEEATTLFCRSAGWDYPRSRSQLGGSAVPHDRPDLQRASDRCVTSKKTILFASLVPDRRPPTSASNMNPKRPRLEANQMRSEYDFSRAVRGKYYERYLESTNVVVLDPDVAKRFKNSTAVNEALRSLSLTDSPTRTRRSARTRRQTSRR